MTELTVFLIPFVIGSMAGAVATLFMTGARRQVHDNEAIALGLIADIAEDSTTGENLPHIARIARIALDGEIGAAPRGGAGGRAESSPSSSGPGLTEGCGND